MFTVANLVLVISALTVIFKLYIVLVQAAKVSSIGHKIHRVKKEEQ